MGSVEAAKAYLMKANSEGLSLYDHLSEVMSKLLTEKPEDALAQLEAISAEVKATKFVPGAAPATAAPVDARMLARCKELVSLIKGPEPVIDADGCVDVPPKNVLAAPTAVGLLEAAEMLERAGLGLGKSETYRVALAIKNLSEDDAEKLTSCKFWGKIYGTTADYLIAEATTGPRSKFLQENPPPLYNHARAARCRRRPMPSLCLKFMAASLIDCATAFASRRINDRAADG